jgi:VanZ family protein
MLDKWVHIGLFGALVTLWCMVRKFFRAKKLINSFIWIGIGGLAYGIIMEFVQLYFVAHRSFEFGDIVADVVGCVVGVTFSWYRYIKK